MTIVDIQDYIQSVYNPNNPTEADILNTIDEMLEQLQTEQEG